MCAKFRENQVKTVEGERYDTIRYCVFNVQ